MYKNASTFYPKGVYLNIDFEDIKRKLKSIENVGIKDYGEIVFIKIKDFMFSINYLGKIDLYYNSISQSEMEDNLKSIESIFKHQIEKFSISI